MAQKVPVPNQIRISGLPKLEELKDRGKAKQQLMREFPGAESAKFFKLGIAYVAFSNESAFKAALERDGEAITIEDHSCVMHIAQLYQRPQTGEPMSDKHAAPENKGNTEPEHKDDESEAKKVGKGTLANAAEEITEGITGFAIGEIVLRVIRMIYSMFRTPEAKKLTEAALKRGGDAINEYMKEMLKEKHDNWLRILHKMPVAEADALEAWIGNPDLVDPAFHDKIVNVFVDYVTDEIDSHGRQKLSETRIADAAADLANFIKKPVTPGPIGNQDRLNRMHGMVGRKRKAAHHVKSLGAGFMEWRRQVNHAIDPTNPNFQPRETRRPHHAGTNRSGDNDGPIRLI